MRLTRKIPPLVRQTCKQLATDTPLRVVCPPLVPRSRIVPISGLDGFWSATHATKGPLSRFYEMSFNAGNPFGTIQWIVAEGTPGSVRHWVLSDRQNEVKGRPRRIGRLYMHGLEAVIYRFPDYPAGGLFGGHLAALVQADGLVFVASIHGYQDARASAEMAVAMAHAR